MNAQFVTCIYDGLYGSKFGGQLNRGRRYTQSLAVISRTNIPITCYTSSAELSPLKAKLNEEGIHNIQFMPYNLSDAYFHEEVDAVRDAHSLKYRDSTDWVYRCVEVMWSKFIFLKNVILDNPNLDYVYWIDAGLSHSGIIHSRFNPHYEHNINFCIDVDKSLNHLTPQNDLIFNERFMPNLIKYTGPTNILNIVSSGDQHFRIQSSGTYKGSAIGGLFGGNVDIVDKYCDKIIHMFEYYLSRGELYKEEQIMTQVLSENHFPTTTFMFDTWYHADWSEGYYKPNLREFSDFFDEIAK